MNGRWWTAHADNLSKLPPTVFIKGKISCAPSSLLLYLHPPTALISPSSFQCVIPLTLNDVTWSILEKMLDSFHVSIWGKKPKKTFGKRRPIPKKKQSWKVIRCSFCLSLLKRTNQIFISFFFFLQLVKPRRNEAWGFLSWRCAIRCASPGSRKKHFPPRRAFSAAEERPSICDKTAASL